MIIVRRYTANLAQQNPNAVSIQETETFDETFSLLSPKTYQTPAIFFPNDRKANAQQLFEALKIDNSTWAIVENEKGLFLVPKEAQEFMLEASDLGEGQVEYQAIALPMVDRERGVVLMSMNQTNSYFQYSHEILTYLFAGTNVFAYDNFGKGLSQGYNTQQGIVDSIDGAYMYLVSGKRTASFSS